MAEHCDPNWAATPIVADDIHNPLRIIEIAKQRSDEPSTISSVEEAVLSGELTGPELILLGLD